MMGGPPIEKVADVGLALRQQMVSAIPRDLAQLKRRASRTATAIRSSRLERDELQTATVQPCMAHVAWAEACEGRCPVDARDSVALHGRMPLDCSVVGDCVRVELMMLV